MSVMLGYELCDLCCGVDAFDFDVELAVVLCEFDYLFCGWDWFVFFCCAEWLELFESIV